MHIDWEWEVPEELRTVQSVLAEFHIHQLLHIPFAETEGIEVAVEIEVEVAIVEVESQFVEEFDIEPHIVAVVLEAVVPSSYCCTSWEERGGATRTLTRDGRERG